MTLTREAAWQLLTEYNKEAFHLRHALTVEGVMRYFANELGYGEEADFWAQVGLLHDLDFEIYPTEHCIKSQEIMREKGLFFVRFSLFRKEKYRYLHKIPVNPRKDSFFFTAFPVK